MKITRELIESGLSERGGLNKMQLQILGVEEFQHFTTVGCEISNFDASLFVELRGQSRCQRFIAESLPCETEASLSEIEMARRLGAALLLDDTDASEWGVIRFSNASLKYHPTSPEACAFIIEDPSGERFGQDSACVTAKVEPYIVAEWRALIDGLTWLARTAKKSRIEWTGVLIEGPSKVVVNSLCGQNWPEVARRAKLRIKFRDQCFALLEEIDLPWFARRISDEASAECRDLAKSVMRPVPLPNRETTVRSPMIVDNQPVILEGRFLPSGTVDVGPLSSPRPVPADANGRCRPKPLPQKKRATASNPLPPKPDVGRFAPQECCVARVFCAGFLARPYEPNAA